MDTWQELPNPQDLQQIVSNPAYASWQSLRESEDARYVGLTMPRVLARLPYGADTVPVKGFSFEEEVQGDHNKYVWMNAAFPMGVNINRSHKLYGWGTQIRGVENGGTVMNLPVHSFPTDDGSIAMKCPTEVAIDDRREAELAKLGLMPILHRKNTDLAAFIGAHSLQDDETRAGRLVDPDAQSNERLSANLPYLFPVSRFAHYLKAIARDKVGSFKERTDMQIWLTEWINRYVLSNPAFADDKARAKRPLPRPKCRSTASRGDRATTMPGSTCVRTISWKASTHRCGWFPNCRRSSSNWSLEERRTKMPLDVDSKLDGFLKIGDIPGASERDGHEEEIEVYGVNFTMTAPYDPTSLSKLGRVSMGTLMLTKQYDKASPMLKMALYTNKKLGDVQFAVRRTIDGASSDYLVVKLTETTVMSYNMHVSPYENGGVEDTFELAYKTIEVEYDGGDPQTMNVATAV